MASGQVRTRAGVPGEDIIRGGPGADELWGGNGDDVIDPGDNDERFDLVHGSAGDDRIVYTGSGPNGYQEIEYSDLDAGVTVTIDGAANQAEVDKGAAGTDTIVDIANPLRAGGSPPYNGGFELDGTSFDDVFDLSLDEGQWMNVEGDAGADTFNLDSNRGHVRIDYESAPAGVDVDLDAGRADDDGFGDADTINGTAQQLAGSEFSDVIRGSDNNETFMGRAGDDIIDGSGGYDQLLFHRWGSDRNLIVRMEENTEGEITGIGTASGTWNGKAFSYTFSNIEHVSGGPGLDILAGGSGDDTLSGRGEADLFLVGESGNDTILDFNEEDDDVIQVPEDLKRDFGLTHADVIAAARQEGDGVLIDLTGYGMGTIFLKYFRTEWLSPGDIWL